MGSDLVDFVASNVGNPLDLDNLLSYGIPFVILYAVTSTQIIRVLIEGGEQEEIAKKLMLSLQVVTCGGFITFDLDSPVERILFFYKAHVLVFVAC